MAFFYGGYNNNPYNSQPNYSNNTFYGKFKSPVDNGPVWFVAVAPIISLLLEEIIMNKIASVVLWIFTYVLSLAVCKYDKEKILARCYDSTAMKQWYLLPVGYLVKRNIVTRQKNYTAIIGIAILIVALSSNGFVKYASVSDDDYINTLQKYPCSEIINFEEYSDITDETILKAVQSYIGHQSIVWTCLTDGEVSNISAICEFDNNGKTSSMKIIFKFYYDGFSFGGIEIVGLEIDGQQLSEEREKAMLMQIFSTEKSQSSISTGVEDNLVEV